MPKLGDLIPKTSDSVSNIRNPLAASINNSDPSDFSQAGPNKKIEELRAKTSSMGQDYKSSFVGDNPAARLANQGMVANQTPVSGEATTNQLKVTISQDPQVGDGPNELVFKVMPRIDEAGGAEYEPITPMQHPGAIQKFRNSTPRTWSVSGRLISRNVAEATENLALINMIRAWRMPFYGNGTAASSEHLGAPPPILTLSAYGPSMIGPVKCVLTNYNWTFDNTLDYIPTEQGNPFPAILDISLQLTESWSPAEFSGFDLLKFKSGDLSETGAFQRVTTSIPATQLAGDISPNEPTSA